MLSEQAAKQIKSIPEWTALEQHLLDAVSLLDRVSDIPNDANFAQTALARQEAISIIATILTPFEIDELSDEDIGKEAREKLGLSD
jgi:hypothetical protein